MTKKKTKNTTPMIVTLGNPKLDSVFGEPLRLSVLDEDGNPIVVHANLAQVIRTFCRSRDAQGQSLAVKSMEDSSRVRTIGSAIQDSIEDGDKIRMSSGDFKWLVRKWREVGATAFPTEASMMLEIFEKKETATAAVEDEVGKETASEPDEE